MIKKEILQNCDFSNFYVKMCEEKLISLSLSRTISSE